MNSTTCNNNRDVPDSTIDDALLSLPLFDNVYFRMQAMNLSMVDEFLVGLESDLLAEYMEIERTPVQSALFVSAISQLWIFGFYELLRTWRQKCMGIICFDVNARILNHRDFCARLVRLWRS